jgi:DNA replication regulator DPB11
MMDLPQKGIVKDTSYILIPHHLVKDDIPSTRDLNKPPVIVTEMWLERCLHSKAFESPDVHVTNTPFPAFPIPDFEELKICSTGFPGIELLHLAKVVKLMGGIYDEDLTSKTSIMICNAKDSRKEKLRHAYEWSIPAVSAEWLWDSIRRTRKMPLETYRIATPQYIIDEAKASREEREKSRDKRSNHDRIEKEHIPHMKDAGISKGKHRTNAESGRSKRPGCPAISKKTVKKGELREVEPTLPIDPEPLPINSNSARTSASTSSEALVPTLPLREISTNSPPKYPATLSPSPPKEALHAQEPPGQLEEDVAQEPPIASAATINTPITQPTPPSTTETDTTTIRKHVSLNTTLSNLLSRKKPKPTAPTNPSAPPPRRRHLLGRANSSSSINPNLKPTTPLPVATFAAPPTTAKPKPLSRATSISSVNSDGLGSVIPTQSQPESQLQSLSTFCKGPEPTSNTDATISAAAQILQWQRNEGLPAHLRPDATGGQVDAAGEGDGVVLTQLGYENASSGGTEKQGVKKGGKVRDIEGFTSIGAAGKSRRSRGRRDL